MKYFACYICGAVLEICDDLNNNPWGAKKFVCRAHIEKNGLLTETVNGLTRVRLEDSAPHPINWNCPTHRSHKEITFMNMNVEELTNQIRNMAKAFQKVTI
jgi:hypothetical protein